jgi:uncharacterized protein DUF3800
MASGIREIAVMLSVYGDESSDETKQRVFAVAGVIGPDEAWKNLEEKWLDRTGGISFHASHCESDRGEYAKTSHEENKALYRDLTILIAESGMGGWGFAIDLAAQREIFPDAPDIAYYRCFIEVLQAMRNCAAFNHHTVKFTFDTRRESEHNAGLLYGMFREMPEWKDVVFSEISFACSRDQPRIQVADLFARETMKLLDCVVGPVKRPPRKSWLTLRETGRFHAEAISIDWFKSLRGQLTQLQERTGMSQDKYHRWLQEHKLQQCTTNLFRYMQRCEGFEQTNVGTE